MISATILHFITIALSTVCASLGVSLGQSVVTQAAFEAINRQPAVQADISRTTLLAIALIETGAILGLLISFLLFFRGAPSLPQAVGEVGIGIAIALPGLFIGWTSSLPAQEILYAIARQPFLATRLNNSLLLTQSILQTPLIFGFMVALAIRAQLSSITTISQGYMLIGSGIAIGFGCIGPALGGGYFTKTACRSAGLNRTIYNRLFTFTFLSQALIETPVIFSAIVALLLATQVGSVADNPLAGAAYILFALTIGLGTLGPGLSSGRSASAAALQIALNPQSYTFVSRASLMAQGLIDTGAIYAFIIALWLILKPLI